MNNGWTGKVMVFLTFITQIVILNFLWIFGVILGGVVLGFAPATRSVGRLVTALGLGEPAQNPWTEFWRHYFGMFWATNSKAWPFTALFALAGADLYAFRVASLRGWEGAGALLAPFILVTVCCVVAFAFFNAAVLRFDDSFAATLKLSLMSPIAFLPTTGAIVLVNAAFVMATWQLPLLVVLVGFSAPIGLSVLLAGHSLDRAYGAGFLPHDALLSEAQKEWDIRAAARAEYANKQRNAL